MQMKSNKSLCWGSSRLGAVFRHAVALGHRLHCVEALGAVATEDGDAERLGLLGGAAHTLLLQHGRLKGVRGPAVTLPLKHNSSSALEEQCSTNGCLCVCVSVCVGESE